MLNSFNTLLVVIVIGFLVLYWKLGSHLICPDNPYGKTKPTTGGHVLWDCAFGDSFADGFVTAANSDKFYKVSLLVECLLERAAAQAEKSGDQVAIVKAQEEHDAYRDLCLRADKVNLGVPYSAL